MRRFALIVAGLAIGMMLGYGILQAVQRSRPISFHGTPLDPPIPAPRGSLTAAGGDVRLSDFKGQVVLLYFGYTFCPDICPATLADLAKVQRAVDDSGEKLQVIMITIDPERDTPAVLADYVTHFHPDFLGLSGSPAQIKAAATAFGIYYAAQAGTADSGYLMDHTASVMLLDSSGNTRALYSFGTPVNEIETDVRALLKKG